MGRTSNTISVLIAVLMALAGARAAPGLVVYVDASATGAETGASWGDAYTSLQDGLLVAPFVGADQIWVAEGTYTPDDGVMHVPGGRLRHRVGHEPGRNRQRCSRRVRCRP
jgi:hypothetical protein